MVFSGAGNFKIGTQLPTMGFWERVRVIHREIGQRVEQEINDIPGRFHFLEMLRPLTNGQVRSLVHLGDIFNVHGSWDRFGLSNLGNIVIDDSDAPFRVKDLRLYIHSFNFRLVGLVPYSFNGEMRFYCVSDERCLSRGQLAMLKREFMALLHRHVEEEDVARDSFLIPAMVAE
jgi:hypothetical protein